MTNDAQSIGPDGDRLDSWKEIAAYLGKGVRTAIRWSKDEGMPVYRHAGSKSGAIYAYRSEIDEWIHSDRSASPRFYRKPAFLWVGAGFALILITAATLLWLNPPTNQPRSYVEERPWVLITDFDNRSGEARFDGTLETALRRELANSRHVLVVAPERVRDTLALMKRAPDVTIDAGLGREICLRYGGKCAVLTGRVENFDSSYLLSIEVLDPADGRSVASAAEEAAGNSAVLPAVHRLSDWLREHLGEELAQISFDEEQLEQAMTPSLRALELYSKGMQIMHPRKATEAEALFRRAVEEDPEFASANLFVFWTLANQGKDHEEEAQSFLKRAMELADSTSEQERLFIEGTYFQLFERDYEKGCGSWKTLAQLFPDHYWAAGNAMVFCGSTLGHREEWVRFAVQTADLRDWDIISAAAGFAFLEGDFDRARPYVERARGIIADEEMPESKIGAWAVSFTEFFPAEEFLDKGLLTDVMSELQRVELALGSMDADYWRGWGAWKLKHFYLALGQIQKAEALNQRYGGEGSRAWSAFLMGDQAAFQEHVEEFHVNVRRNKPDPTERLIWLLSWNMQWTMRFPLDALVPLYDPESAVALASATGEPAPVFLSTPKFEAKLQLAQGKQLLNQGQPDEAITLLRNSVAWFRDHGIWLTFSYYFLSAELLAVALAEQGDLEAAYRELEEAAGQRKLVNSFTTPQHQKIQARQALLARELGRTAEAEAIEAELAKALVFADPDHPILVQIRAQQEVLLQVE
jgi:tetratricopeptide (TPR) repeat protein